MHSHIKDSNGNIIHTIKQKSFVGADLSNLDLSDAYFSGMNLRGVSFQNSVFNKAVMVECDLTDTNFSSTVLNNVDFSHSNLKGAKFTNAYCCQGDFSYCTLNQKLFDDMTFVRFIKLKDAQFG